MFGHFLVLMIGVSSITAASNTVSSRAEIIKQKQYIWNSAFSECLKLSMMLAAAVTKDKAGILENPSDSCTCPSPLLKKGESTQDEKFQWTELGDCIRISKMLANVKEQGQVVCRINSKESYRSAKIIRRKEYILINSLKDFNGAKEDCKRRGLRLGTVENEEEQGKLLELLRKQSRGGWVWLGGSIKKTGGWAWESSGRPLNYTAWLPFRPGLSSVSDWMMNLCIAANGHSGLWFDDPCTFKYDHVCENPI